VARHNVASPHVLDKCGFVVEAEPPTLREDGIEEVLLRLDA
jgi:hypothetical protein